ncbi:hypothetical protein A5791_20775 [Mycobacterium sp. 852002-51163_SCH5372311]|uniref:hypothetical protein n=1 Tax=Mycobacterium sp. 852002-51163_SCH5372311 TaxID=1834097 RepID=UPI000800056C|nr:hypothetical protein [Mycobacterium sp. 852002-51163_SCH5372311]OBF86268.1 hypothetical protein A5791_20775 [Mycobacterium sp. 852002-51163_SCH5372311]
MAELDTPDQALAYLAQIDPNTSYDVLRFEMGWICSPILTPEQAAGSEAVGSTKLVVDSQTGVVMEFPSWSTDMVAEDYIEAKRTGRPPPARQIYPYRWRITLRRIREDPEIITYQMKAVSLSDPPEPTQDHPLTINKRTLLNDPPDTLSSMARAHAIQVMEQNHGTWPAETASEL